MDLNNDRLTPAAQATLDEIVTNYRDRILEILLKSDLKRIGPPDVLRVEEVGRNSATLANLLELSTSFQDTNFRRMRRYSLMLLSISVFQAVIAVGLTAAYYLFPADAYTVSLLVTFALIFSSCYMLSFLIFRAASRARLQSQIIGFQSGLISDRDLYAFRSSSGPSFLELSNTFMDKWQTAEHELGRIAKASPSSGLNASSLGDAISRLSSRDLISDNDEIEFRHLLRLRNSIVHRPGDAKITQSDINDLENLIQSLKRK